MITIGFQGWNWSQLRGIIIFLIKWSDKWAHLVCAINLAGSFLCVVFFLATFTWQSFWQYYDMPFGKSGWNILVRQARVAFLSQMISSHILVDGNWSLLLLQRFFFFSQIPSEWKRSNRTIAISMKFFTYWNQRRTHFTLEITLQWIKTVKANIGTAGFLGKCILQRIFFNKAFMSQDQEKNTVLYHNVISFLKLP